MSENNIFPSFSEEYDKQFYKLVFEYLGEEIYVTDKNGKTLYVNPASVKTIGKPIDQIVGRNVEDLVKDGFFSVSSTMEVIKKKKTVNVLQKMLDGRTLLATGIPIFDDVTGEIVMIISTSKNVDELNELLHTVEKQAEVIEKNIEELKNLKASIFENEGFIFERSNNEQHKKYHCSSCSLGYPCIDSRQYRSWERGCSQIAS